MSIRKISEGNYEVRLSLTVDGKPQAVRKRGFVTKRDAQDYEAEQRRTRNIGGVIKASRITLHEHANEWLTVVAKEIEATTHASYTNALNAYILPKLGEIALRDLTTSRIQAWVNELEIHGKTGGGFGGNTRIGKPLSPKSTRNIFSVLRACLTYAVELKRVAGNPCENVRLARIEAKEMNWFNHEQLASILAAADGDRFEAIWWVQFLSTVRRGEMLGLTWQCVDFDNKCIRVRHNRVRAGNAEIVTTPKTAAGRREIPLDDDTIAFLRTWRNTQRQERLIAGEGWVGGDLANCAIVTEPNGKPTHISSYRRRYNALLRRANVPAFNMHASRHTAITALAPFLSPHILQRVAGHTSFAFTLNRYGHAMPQEASAGMNALAKSLRKRKVGE